jgi:Ca2+:H+ antiporter
MTGRKLHWIRAEIPLLVSAVTYACLRFFGDALFADLSNTLVLSLLFAWLFLIILWSAFAVVRHADALAIRLGEPYGTLILTLSVISIEVMMVVAVMLTGSANPELARDTMFAIIMIVLNGLVGITLILGAVKHKEQEYNFQGSNAFLAVIIPLSVLGLVLPNYTQSTVGPVYSWSQKIFALVVTLGLYGVFLSVQTVRHKTYFMAPAFGSCDDFDEHDHGGLIIRPIPFHALILATYLIVIVLLSKKIAILIDHSISQLGAPGPLGGFLVAVLVLSPEGLGAVRSALANRLQRSINIFLGSVAATIGLTIPAVLGVSFVTGREVVLGLPPVEAVMLLTTLAVSLLTLASGRTNLLQGAVHLVLFVAYVVMIFD